jgi:hypothetical protein
MRQFGTSSEFVFSTQLASLVDCWFFGVLDYLGTLVIFQDDSLSLRFCIIHNLGLDLYLYIGKLQP